MYRLSMILQNNFDFIIFIQAELVRTDKCNVSKIFYVVFFFKQKTAYEIGQ